MQIIIHPAEEVENQPQVDIMAWSIHEVCFHDENEVHLLTGFVLDKKWRGTTAIQHLSMANRIEPVSAIKIEPLFPVNMNCLASISADNFPLRA